MFSLIIGGARSGKSRFAQSLAGDARRVVLIATARAEDAEMAARIAHHRQDRLSNWMTIEEPLEIGAAVERHAGSCDFLLLDCLTLWLSNLSFAHRTMPAAELQARALREVGRLAAASAGCNVAAVSNEVGYALVPETEVGRAFRDLQGWVNQAAARSADCVYLVVAGIPVTIKQPGGGR